MKLTNENIHVGVDSSAGGDFTVMTVVRGGDVLGTLPEGFDERTRFAVFGDSVVVTHPDKRPYVLPGGYYL